MSEQRIIELETKISHHENDIEALQKVSYEHEKAIAKLIEQLEKLSMRVVAGNGDGLDIGPGDEKPPHY